MLPLCQAKGYSLIGNLLSLWKLCLQAPNWASKWLFALCNPEDQHFPGWHWCSSAAVLITADCPGQRTQRKTPTCAASGGKGRVKDVGWRACTSSSQWRPAKGKGVFGLQPFFKLPLSMCNSRNGVGWPTEGSDAALNWLRWQRGLQGSSMKPVWGRTRH